MGQVSKLNFVDAKLGTNTGGQQTTRTLFHTITNNVLASNPLQLTFFKNFQGLTPGQTNLTTNKLDSMESMVIKTISFYQISYNVAQDRYTLSNQFCASGSVVTVKIGNQEVVKKLPLSFVQMGQSFDRLHANAGSAIPFNNANLAGQNSMPTEIRLLTDIVLPPQVSFEVYVEGSNSAYQGVNSAIVCALSGYGKIFSAGNSF